MLNTHTRRILDNRLSPREDGFTLVELLVVVVILVVLAAIATPIFLGQLDKSKDARAKTSVATAAQLLGDARATSGSATYNPTTRNLAAFLGGDSEASAAAGQVSHTLSPSQKIYNGNTEITGSAVTAVDLATFCFEDLGSGTTYFHMSASDTSAQEGACVAGGGGGGGGGGLPPAPSGGTASVYASGTESYGFSSGAGRSDFSLALTNISPAIEPDAAAALTNGGATFTIRQGGTAHYVGSLSCSHEMVPFTTSVACVNGDISTSPSYVPMDPGVATVTFTVGADTYTVSGEVPIY